MEEKVGAAEPPAWRGKGLRVGGLEISLGSSWHADRLDRVLVSAQVWSAWAPALQRAG